MYHTAESSLFRVPGTVRDDKTKRRRLGWTPAARYSQVAHFQPVALGRLLFR